MPLTHTAIKNAKPSAKSLKMFDGEGLYLEISPNGGKWWRFKYRFLDKEKRISLGTYPDTSLQKARERKTEMRQLLANGIDPSLHRQAYKASKIESQTNSFQVIAREWLERYEAKWTPAHRKKLLQRLENDIFPSLGTTPITNITAPALLSTLRKIEHRGAIETAHRALSNCSQIFRYAIATGRAERDTAADLRGALSPIKNTHFTAITDPKKVGALLRAMDDYDGSPIVTAALKLAPLFFVRPGELRQAKWADIDWEQSQWRYLVTKTKTDHIVPLSNQAIAILKSLYPITCQSEYIFPSARTRKRPMSDNAILAALRRLDISKEEMTGHGFRAMARTLLDEVLHVRPDYIEHQLAHAVRDPNGRAYNRTAFLPERKKMMQDWADYLDALKKS